LKASSALQALVTKMPDQVPDFDGAFWPESAKGKRIRGTARKRQKRFAVASELIDSMNTGPLLEF